MSHKKQKSSLSAIRHEYLISISLLLTDKDSSSAWAEGTDFQKRFLFLKLSGSKGCFPSLHKVASLQVAETLSNAPLLLQPRKGRKKCLYL